MKTNPFFTKSNNIHLSDVIKTLGLKTKLKNIKLNDIKILNSSNKNDITFFNSSKYNDLLNNSKAKYIIINKKHINFLDKSKHPLVVSNVLKSVALVTKLFYKNSLNDNVDKHLNHPILKKYKSVYFGKNVLIGKNVTIGKNSTIGHNSIIESNVILGPNCDIGNNVIIKNSFIGKNVRILDGAIIGKKGFGFFPNDKTNFRYPHIGMVIIKDYVEIGSNSTIDRGSLSNTVISENTFIDNQVHIAHNVEIGKNCIITAQVGFAGSAKIGNSVHIGGQAGISGHLRIGDNVKIGGGSGVINSLADNSRVMGYPAKDIRIFLKRNK